MILFHSEVELFFPFGQYCHFLESLLVCFFKFLQKFHSHYFFFFWKITCFIFLFFYFWKLINYMFDYLCLLNMNFKKGLIPVSLVLFSAFSYATLIGSYAYYRSRKKNKLFTKAYTSKQEITKILKSCQTVDWVMIMNNVKII